MILTETKEYINTMLTQIGGNSFLLMVGHVGPIIINYNSKNAEYSAIIKVRGAISSIVSMRMIYCRGKDLYRIEYLNVVGDIVSSDDDLFFDDMESSVRRNTGLETRLPSGILI